MDTMYNYKQMVFYNIAFEGNNGWFCHVYYNALCRFDLRTNEILLETMIPCDNTSIQKYGNIFYYDKKLYLSPKNNKRILIYDLETKTFDEVTLDDSYMGRGECFNILSGITVHKGSLYFFPGRYQAIVKLNMSTLQVTYLNDWINDLKSDILDEKRVIFSSLCRIGSEILLPFWQGNKIMKFNMENDSFEIINVGEKDNQYAAVTFDGRYYWLASKNKTDIYRWDGETDIQTINHFPAGFESRYGIRHLVKSLDNILVFPLCGNMIVEIDSKSMRMKNIYSLEMKPEKSVLNFLITDNNFLEFSVYNDILYAYSVFNGCIFCIDLKTKEVKQIKALMSFDSDLLKVKGALRQTRFEQSGHIIRETSVCTLELFLEVVEFKNNKYNEEVNKSEIGKQIYSKLQNEII